MASAYTQPTTSLAPLRMSYDEWQTWLGRNERNRGEWVDGEVVVFAMPKHLHQAIMFLLARLMAEFVEAADLGEIAADGTEMWLPERRTARLPDVFFVSAEHRDRLTDERLNGPADLAVEVISDDSVTRDRRRKFAEYQDAGIPEYWIVDPRPRRHTVSVYVLDADGQYQERPGDDEGRVHSSVLPGFWIDPAWLWQNPRPKASQLMARIMAEAER
ncbi:MAG: Uma2 family endonuclease [Chloroflexia bacterium]|nr:Uma2 family endonuclease [Chloroflexia bacterium]